MICTINRLGAMSWFVRSTARPRGATTLASGDPLPTTRSLRGWWRLVFFGDVPLNLGGDRT
jgi:hypothetical protein